MATGAADYDWSFPAAPVSNAANPLAMAGQADSGIGLMVMETTAADHRNDINGHASTADLVKALNHPSRRVILRRLLKTAPASSKEIRLSSPGLDANRINFHFGILVAAGAAIRHHKQFGYRENFYSPTDAVRAPWCLTVLKLTAAED